MVPESSLNQIILLIQQQEFLAALGQINELLQTYPDDFELLQLKADSLVQLDELEPSRSLFQQMIEQHPSQSVGYTGLGVVCLRQQQYDQARVYLSKAIKLDPDNPVPYYHRSLCYSDTGKLKKALKDVERLIQLAPTKADFYVNRMVLLLQMKRYRLALADCETLLQMKSDPASVASAYFHRGRIWVEKSLSQDLTDEQYEQMESDLVTAIELLEPLNQAYPGTYQSMLFEATMLLAQLGYEVEGMDEDAFLESLMSDQADLLDDSDDEELSLPETTLNVPSLPRRVDPPTTKIQEKAIATFMSALDARQRGDLKGAIWLCDEAVAAAPEYFIDGAPWGFKSQILLMLERLDDAIVAADQALEVFPCCVDALISRAIARYQIWQSTQNQPDLVQQSMIDLALAIRFATDQGDRQSSENARGMYRQFFPKLH